MKRAGIVGGLIGVAFAVSCVSAKGFLEQAFKPQPAFSASITVDMDHPGHAVNRLILGNNLQWVDNGDEILKPNSLEFDPGMLDLVKPLHPTVLRYPGGSHSDTYHWRDGVGSFAQRRENEHFHNHQKQKVDFGTAEFLTLCKLTGAEPLITVNVASGTPEEAAEWVRAVNKDRIQGADGSPLPTCQYWEIGNEPYLVDAAQTQLGMQPEEYARRANLFLRAMREADPSIRMGVPLRSDRIGTTPATPLQGFNDKVLAAVTERYDFVSVHDAYVPVLLNPNKSIRDEDLFKGTMAGSRVVEQDLEFTQSLLRKYQPGRTIPIAITEYNALYTFGGSKATYPATLGGALVVADLIQMYARRDDLLMANYWSMTGDGPFGAVSNRREVRPSHEVLLAAERVLRGRLVPVDVSGPTFDCPEVGIVPATKGIPTIAALATTEEGVLRLLLINKDARRGAAITLAGPGGRIVSAEYNEMGAGPLFDPRQAVHQAKLAPVPLRAESFPVQVTMGAHSVGMLEIKMAHDARPGRGAADETPRGRRRGR